MRWPRLSPASPEVLLAVGLTVALELEVASAARFTAGRALVALVITVPLALRLRVPMTVLGLVLTGFVLEAALRGSHPGPHLSDVAVLLVLYTVGSRSGGVRLALGAWHDARRDVCRESLGRLRRGDERGGARSRDGLWLVDRPRSARIARELHHVIGHSISVMGVQAGAVRSVLREDQPRERETLIAVERTGRQAVGEMRRLMGLLRSEQDGLGGPAPSLRRVEQLVGEMRAAGLAVQLSVHGDLAVLSPGSIWPGTGSCKRHSPTR